MSTLHRTKIYVVEYICVRTLKMRHAPRKNSREFGSPTPVGGETIKILGKLMGYFSSGTGPPQAFPQGTTNDSFVLKLNQAGLCHYSLSIHQWSCWL